MTECESISTCSEFEVLVVLSERDGKISPFLTVNTDLQYFVPRPPSTISFAPSCSPSPLMLTNPIAHPPCAAVEGTTEDKPVAQAVAEDEPEDEPEDELEAECIQSPEIATHETMANKEKTNEAITHDPSYVLSPVRKGPTVKSRKRRKRGRVAAAPVVMIGVVLLIILI